jgi:hypothetical protein
MFSQQSWSSAVLKLAAPCTNGRTYVPNDHSAGGKESLNLFEPLFGAAPASDIVTSLESEPCEKLYPSSTPTLNVLAVFSLPLNNPVPVLVPSCVVVPDTLLIVTTKPEPPASVDGSLNTAVPFSVTVSVAAYPAPLKLLGTPIVATAPLPPTDST